MSLLGSLVELQENLLKVKDRALYENKQDVVLFVDNFYPEVVEILHNELAKQPIIENIRSKR